MTRHLPNLSRALRRYTNVRAWLRGLLKAGIEGFVTAALASGGTAVADAAGLAAGLDLGQAATVGLSGGIVSIFVFLKSQPLPEEPSGTRPPMQGVD